MTRPKADTGLPEGVTYSKRRKRFIYTRTDGKVFPLNHDDGTAMNREEAIAAGNEINGYRAGVSIKVTNNLPFGQFIKLHFDELAERKEWTPLVVKQYQRHLHYFLESPISKKFAGNISVQDVGNFLSQFKPNMSNRRRSFLIVFFDYAVPMGQCPLNWNPARAALVHNTKRVRKRLTLEQFKAIRAVAHPKLRLAMDLAITTLQRVSDLSAFKWADIKNGHWELVQKKTGAAVKIDMAPLKSVLDECKSDCISPYILHYFNPKRPSKIGGAVLPTVLTLWFQQARDSLGWEMKKGELPPFHEIRALGADLYRQAGWPESAIQRLLGHTNIKMTQRYLDDHKINFDRVEAVTAGLVI